MFFPFSLWFWVCALIPTLDRLSPFAGLPKNRDSTRRFMNVKRTCGVLESESCQTGSSSTVGVIGSSSPVTMPTISPHPLTQLFWVSSTSSDLLFCQQRSVWDPTWLLCFSTIFCHCCSWFFVFHVLLFVRYLTCYCRLCKIRNFSRLRYIRFSP